MSNGTKTITDFPGFAEYEFPIEIAKLIVDSKVVKLQKLWKTSLTNNNKDPHESRTSSEISFDFFSKEIKNKTIEVLENCKNLYNQEYKHANLNKSEKISLLKYQDFQYFEEHADIGVNLYRTTSAIVYLNPNEYQGGETYFTVFDLYVKPKTPTIIFFPSNYIYAHKAMPVISGEKMVLVTWFNNLPDKFIN